MVEIVLTREMLERGLELLDRADDPSDTLEETTWQFEQNGVLVAAVHLREEDD